jgi:catechol 2,3-dioxygenase
MCEVFSRCAASLHYRGWSSIGVASLRVLNGDTRCGYPRLQRHAGQSCVLTVGPGASRAFYVDALGFAVSDEDANTLYLRGIEEACHHSLVLKRAKDSPVCERVGLRVYTEDDLEKAKGHFERASLPAKWVEAAHQGRTLHVSDAIGTPLEFCATMETRPRLIVQFKQHKGACPLRIDHIQVLSPDVQKACEFYSALGFRVSEYIAVDGTDDLVFVFLQRRKSA